MSTAATPPVRQTRQRAAVREALEGSQEFRSAQELHDMLRASGVRVGLTTVYRCLASLADTGEVDQLVTDDGETVYRKCGMEHHHHLVCRQCGRTVEVAGPAVESWADQVALDHGFTDVSHTLELFGICADCARR